MNLYLIETQAMGEYYVVEENPHKAYQVVKSYLDGKDRGFSYERTLRNIRLIAESDEYTKLPRLFGAKEAE